jgi:glutamate racemase
LHKVFTAYELGWSTLKNGELLTEAETSGFEVLVTTDTNMQYQQNLSQRKIALVVLSTTSWPKIQKAIPQVVKAIDSADGNSFEMVSIK